MKGYKGFDKDLRCKGFQYEIGKEYLTDEKPSFHFCANLKDVHGYYNLGGSRICEVEALGDIVTGGDKCVTNRIKIVRELGGEEVLSLANTGKNNTGFLNSGDYNSGDNNSGYRNSGNSNSGSFNSCNNSAGLFMSERISYEAFNKTLTEKEYEELKNSEGYNICLRFRLIKYRIRKKTGKFGYMSYKNSWRVFWGGLSFAERNAVRKMPHLDKAVFEEITGVKL